MLIDGDLKQIRKGFFKIFIFFFIIGTIVIKIPMNQSSFLNTNKNSRLRTAESESWVAITNIETISEYNFKGKLIVINHSIFVIEPKEEILRILKYNQTGTKIDEYKFNFSNTISSFYVLVDSSNNFIILMNYFFFSGTSTKTVFLKIDQMGNQLVLKDMTAEYGIEGICNCIMDNNNSIIFSNPSSIGKIDLNGTLLWNYHPHQNGPFGLNYDSQNNVYFISKEKYDFNSSLGKINSTGYLLWNNSLKYVLIDLEVDSNNNLYLIGKDEWSYDGYLLKFNSSGDLLKEEEVEDEVYQCWIFENNSIYVLYSTENTPNYIGCYDLNLNHNWNYTFSNYLPLLENFEYWLPLVADSNGNLLALLNKKGVIGIFEFTKLGEEISFTKWGGGYLLDHSNLVLDSEDNTFFVCKYLRIDMWGERTIYTFLVKNPKDGDLVPFPPRSISLYDYIIFLFLGVSVLVSIMLLFLSLRNRKKSIR